MRFVFCIIIILFHLNNRISVVFNEDFSFFRHGRIGVEFFFLVSGYLLANTAHRQYSTNDIVKSTTGFMYKKVKSIFPYHVFVFFVDMAIFYVFKEWEGISLALRRFASYIPGLFFLQKSGIKYPCNAYCNDGALSACAYIQRQVHKNRQPDYHDNDCRLSDSFNR